MGKLRAVVGVSVAVASIAFVLAGCSCSPAGSAGGGTGSGTTSGTGTPTTTPAPGAKLTAGMVPDIFGITDKQINAQTEAGLHKAAIDLGVSIDVIPSKAATDYAPNLKKAAAAGDDPVFAVGFLETEALQDVAAAHPKTRFVGVDTVFPQLPANVACITFKEQEAGYLAGVVAGRATRSNFDSRLNTKNVIGFVGSMAIPQIQAYGAGFAAGAKSVNPSVKIVSKYATSFDDVAQGKALGLSVIASGADVVFAATRQTSVGVFDACTSKKALFIGSEYDRYLSLPGPGTTVLTSAIKRVDNAVYQVVKSAAEGAFPGGRTLAFGVTEDGVGLAPFHTFDGKLPKSIKDAVAKAIAEIKSGAVVVPVLQ